MKRTYYLAFGVILILTIVVSFFRDQGNTYRSIDFIHSKTSITKARSIIISAPSLSEEKQIDIIDKTALDSLTNYLQIGAHPIKIQRAKLNDVLIILELFKGKDSIRVKVYNSKYTGCVSVPKIQMGAANW